MGRKACFHPNGRLLTSSSTWILRKTTDYVFALVRHYCSTPCWKSAKPESQSIRAFRHGVISSRLLWASDRAQHREALVERCVLTSKRDLAGCVSCAIFNSAGASLMTWDWGKRSRCWRCWNQYAPKLNIHPSWSYRNPWLFNWLAEAAKFTPRLKTLEYVGTQGVALREQFCDVGRNTKSFAVTTQLSFRKKSRISGSNARRSMCWSLCCTCAREHFIQGLSMRLR